MKAQSSTEYLIVFAIVMIILGVIISMFLDVSTLGSESRESFNHESFAFGSVGIESFALSHNCSYITLVNNEPFDINITSVMLDSFELFHKNYSLKMWELESNSFFSCGFNYTQTEQFNVDLHIEYYNLKSLQKFQITHQNIIGFMITDSQKFYTENKELLVIQD